MREAGVSGEKAARDRISGARALMFVQERGESRGLTYFYRGRCRSAAAEWTSPEILIGEHGEVTRRVAARGLWGQSDPRQLNAIGLREKMSAHLGHERVSTGPHFSKKEKPGTTTLARWGA